MTLIHLIILSELFLSGVPSTSCRRDYAGSVTGWRKPLTEHSSGRHRLSIEPEGDLGQDDRHDAGQIRLDHKVADLPLQMEVSRHDRVFTWGQEVQVSGCLCLWDPPIFSSDWEFKKNTSNRWKSNWCSVWNAVPSLDLRLAVRSSPAQTIIVWTGGGMKEWSKDKPCPLFFGYHSNTEGQYAKYLLFSCKTCRCVWMCALNNLNETKI